jgi:hypothetical protein
MNRSPGRVIRSFVGFVTSRRPAGMTRNWRVRARSAARSSCRCAPSQSRFKRKRRLHVHHKGFRYSVEQTEHGAPLARAKAHHVHERAMRKCRNAPGFRWMYTGCALNLLATVFDPKLPSGSHDVIAARQTPAMPMFYRRSPGRLCPLPGRPRGVGRRCLAIVVAVDFPTMSSSEKGLPEVMPCSIFTYRCSR